MDDGQANELPTPHCILGDHTLPITDIACGVGEFPRCRVLTSSLDYTVKVGVFPGLLPMLIQIVDQLRPDVGPLVHYLAHNVLLPTTNHPSRMGRYGATVFRGLSGRRHTPGEPLQAAKTSQHDRHSGITLSSRSDGKRLSTNFLRSPSINSTTTSTTFT